MLLVLDPENRCLEWSNLHVYNQGVMIVMYRQIFFNDQEAAARKVNRKSDVVSSGDLLHPAIVNSQ